MIASPADLWRRCPVCRARLKESPRCRRCETDFSAAMEKAKESRALSRQARIKLRSGLIDEGEEEALQAGRKRLDADTLQTLALAALARRSFPRALSLWSRWKESVANPCP